MLFSNRFHEFNHFANVGVSAQESARSMSTFNTPTTSKEAMTKEVSLSSCRTPRRRFAGGHLHVVSELSGQHGQFQSLTSFHPADELQRRLTVEPLTRRRNKSIMP